MVAEREKFINGAGSVQEKDATWKAVQHFKLKSLNDRESKYFNTENKLLNSWLTHYRAKNKDTGLIENKNMLDLEVFQRHYVAAKHAKDFKVK